MLNYQRVETTGILTSHQAKQPKDGISLSENDLISTLQIRRSKATKIQRWKKNVDIRMFHLTAENIFRMYVSMGVSINEWKWGIPKRARWMVYFRENPNLTSMDILGT